MLWEEGLVLSQSCHCNWGSLEKIPINVGRGIYHLMELQVEIGASSGDDYPVPAGCPSRAAGPGIPRGIAGMGCPLPCACKAAGLLSCATHQPCFSERGPNVCSPPDISISRGVSLQQVK